MQNKIPEYIEKLVLFFFWEISSLNKNFILEIQKIDKKRKREGGENKGKESSNLRS